MNLLTPKEAGAYLKVSTNTLATWRHKKQGPRFMRTGRVIKYTREDLDAYLRNNTVETKGGKTSSLKRRQDEAKQRNRKNNAVKFGPFPVCRGGRERKRKGERK
ncbi:MAG: helix-turn-helix domain-containing protein [Thermodesulfovibrionales bacterium]|jgi:excisionase family DNA binding protein